MDRLRQAAMFCLSFGTLVLVWQPPGQVLRTAIPMLTTAEIPRHVAASLARVAVGFSLGRRTGSSWSTPCSACSGTSRIGRSGWEPRAPSRDTWKPTAREPHFAQAFRSPRRGRGGS